jgi:hypothetical protein
MTKKNPKNNKKEQKTYKTNDVIKEFLQKGVDKFTVSDRYWFLKAICNECQFDIDPFEDLAEIAEDLITWSIDCNEAMCRLEEKFMLNIPDADPKGNDMNTIFEYVKTHFVF